MKDGPEEAGKRPFLKGNSYGVSSKVQLSYYGIIIQEINK